MHRHKDLITFLAAIPFVALLPVLFPRPEYSVGQTLLALAYLAIGLAAARIIAIGLARASLPQEPPQDRER